MYRSLEYSLSGERPDRSRFAINYSESTFQPSPSDLAIDQALEEFAAITLQGGTNSSRRRIDSGSQYTSYRPSNLNPQPLPYATSYAPSKVGSSTVSRQPPLKMIAYPGPGSTVSTRSHRSRQAPIAQYQYAQPSVVASQYTRGLKALSRHSGKSKRSQDPYDEVGPEDSISQVSSSSRRSGMREMQMYEPPESERRGRTRRREDERSTVVGSGRYGGSEYDGQGGGYGVAPAYYETREVTPWD